MDFGAAFSFVTADPDWVKKLGIASVVALAGVLTLGLALIPLVGYAVAISRRVSEGTQPVLPEWEDFGQLFMDGLKIVGIGFVWALPIILISACVGLVGALLTGQTDDATASSLLSILVSCVSVPYAILLALIQPAAIGHLAHTGNFGQAINPLNAFKILRANVGGFVITALVWIILFPILQSIGLLICIIGVFPAIAYGTAVLGHLVGQAYKGAQATGFELAGA
jgi:hypothetical protein